MSQHDYVIDNSTGQNVRQDINSVLQAIASNNSGSSAPSTTYAFQLFADTTNNVMKIRNSANNAYIELFKLDGTFTNVHIESSTPSLKLSDTGNSSAFCFLDGNGANLNIHADKGNTVSNSSMGFFLDNSRKMTLKSSGNFGIGESSPSHRLHISAAENSTIAYFDTALGGRGLKINTFTSGGAASAGVEFEAPAGANKSAFVFKGATEFARIGTDGSVGIGTSSISNKLHVTTTSGEAAALRVQTVSANTNQEFVVFFRANTSATGGIRRDGNNAGPAFFTSSDRRLKTNIVDMDNILDKIKQLSIKKFDYKDGTASGIGLIAQDLINIFPDKVTKDDSDDGTGDTIPDGVEPWTVGHNFTFELLKAVQELIARVEALEAA